ncbi:MAG: hypothetical protein CMJ28_00285 [Phycisphaerae bacterium]|nr:hypothetical protein [Phycisphaerae bacterium]
MFALHQPLLNSTTEMVGRLTMALNAQAVLVVLPPAVLPANASKTFRSMFACQLVETHNRQE